MIGIGAGDPEQVTVQAIRALNETDVFFVFAKTGEREELVRLRHEILERYVEDPSARRDRRDPRRRARPRRRGLRRGGRGLAARPRRSLRAGGRAMRSPTAEPGRSSCGATRRSTTRRSRSSTTCVSRGELELAVEVIPGISSVQALAARHGIPLNRVGGAIQITTGRRLASGLPEGADDVVVMLDANCAFRDTGGHRRRRHLLGRLHRDRGRAARRRRRARRGRRDRARARGGARPQGLDHGHLPPAPRAMILILGGTAEARELAAALHAEGAPVVSSLAGRVANPRLPDGEVRIGGFGGPEALAGWLGEHGISAVVDATHPFAERISESAGIACTAAGVPLLRLERPGWSERDGDDWHWVDDLGRGRLADPGAGKPRAAHDRPPGPGGLRRHRGRLVPRALRRPARATTAGPARAAARPRALRRSTASWR